MSYDVVDGCIEYETSSGELLRFYTPPDQIIAGLTPYPKPKRPTIEMSTKVGTQKRFVKNGDPEFDAWQDDIVEWNEACNALRDCARLVLSLEEFKYPDPIVLPDYVADLIEEGLLEEPHNRIELKASYLRSTVLRSGADENESYFIIQQLTGVPEEVIDKMKDEFRNLLLGSTTDRDRRENVESNGEE